MFLLNSHESPFTAILPCGRTPLLPKLRGYFAEFLNEKSLERLRIFSLPTCVGLRYGHQTYSLRGFSWQRGIKKLACPKTRFPAFLRVNDPADLPTESPLNCGQTFPVVCRPTFLRPPIAGLVPGWSVAPEGVPLVPWIRPGRDQGGTGISTSRPSPTSVDLGLGPD